MTKGLVKLVDQIRISGHGQRAEERERGSAILGGKHRRRERRVVPSTRRRAIGKKQLFLLHPLEKGGPPTRLVADGDAGVRFAGRTPFELWPVERHKSVPRESSPTHWVCGVHRLRRIDPGFARRVAGTSVLRITRESGGGERHDCHRQQRCHQGRASGGAIKSMSKMSQMSHPSISPFLQNQSRSIHPIQETPFPHSDRRKLGFSATCEHWSRPISGVRIGENRPADGETTPTRRPYDRERACVF